MKLIALALRRETEMPVLALLAATAASVAMVFARIVWTGRISYGFLIWNLFLAWLPLVFALLACDAHRRGMSRSWRFVLLAGSWLVFFPNAPYIFTDIIHLMGGMARHFWVDLALVLTCALTGLVLGFVSLYLMQRIVAVIWGRVASWLVICAVAGLSGIGIYLGRFLRFNSWDIIANPVDLFRAVAHLTVHPRAHSNSLGFAVLFSVFLFLAYIMLYALTHLSLEPGSSGHLAPRQDGDDMALAHGRPGNGP